MAVFQKAEVYENKEECGSLDRCTTAKPLARTENMITSARKEVENLGNRQ